MKSRYYGFTLAAVLTVVYCAVSLAGSSFLITYSYNPNTTNTANSPAGLVIGYNAQSSVCWSQNSLPSVQEIEQDKTKGPFATATQTTGGCYLKSGTLALNIKVHDSTFQPTICLFSQNLSQEPGCGPSGCLKAKSGDCQIPAPGGKTCTATAQNSSVAGPNNASLVTIGIICQGIGV
ncbi:MAG: hypothetical protein A3F41_00075 [Coxiella sp. RIFCSPHIGHO2_12_FULL_44_14]|nr:MAG: hypothetical protein A3F41_00075 [Coxiella sp. RIFCSPHIGHO2_12_FULL_44_14]